MQKTFQNLPKRIKNYIYFSQAKIGKGASSIVYKGKNINNNQEIAIKVIELKTIKNDVQRMLLTNQIKALKSIEHENTIKTFQVCQTTNNIYIINELCEEGDLSTLIKNKGKFSEQEALRIFQEIVKGLNHIHLKDILHRDLKSSNILLKNNKVKICDFGYAEFRNENKGQVFYNVGSPLYMSPEAYRNTKYSIKSDCWAIGIILYELLIGEQPFKGISYDMMLKSISCGQIYKNLNVTGFVKMLLSRLLSIDIQRRIETEQILKLLKQNKPRILSEKTSISNIPLKINLRHNRSSVQILSKRNELFKQNVENQLIQQKNTVNTPTTIQNVSNSFKNNLNNQTQIKFSKNGQSTNKKQDSKYSIKSRIQFSELLVNICSGVHIFNQSNETLKKIFFLTLKHFNFQMEKLTQSFKYQNPQLQYRKQYGDLMNVLHGFLVLYDFKCIKNDEFFSFLIDKVEPSNQIYFTYLKFWLKNGSEIIYSICQNKLKSDNCDVQKFYRLYTNILKYSQILNMAKLTSQYVNLCYSNNKQIQNLIKDSIPINFDTLHKLKQISANLIKI